MLQVWLSVVAVLGVGDSVFRTAYRVLYFQMEQGWCDRCVNADVSVRLGLAAVS